MDCHQTGLLMTAHLAGSETGGDRETLRMHLDSCPACRAEAELLASTWKTLGALPEAEVPAGAWERIRAQLPAPEPARRAPWAASLATAGLGLLVSIAASWLLPYERAARLCGEGLRRFFSAPALSDPAVFFAVGILYGLLPLGLAALVAARGTARAGRGAGLGASLVFMLLVLPYILVACSGLPAAITAALVAGILTGALAGGPAGTWAGDRFLFPART